jgi:hypothetical protein
MCRTDLSSLAPFAVDLRYPGRKVDLQTKNKAWHTCGRSGLLPGPNSILKADLWFVIASTVSRAKCATARRKQK